MLTVDFARLRLGPGMRLLDLGCGRGRHSFEALRRGTAVIAADLDEEALAEVQAMGRAMFAAGQSGPGGALIAVRANALSLPFPDGCFDVVIASEVLEHIPEDLVAMREIARVLRPGGMVAVTVPRRFPERLCWILSDSYHETAGGHVRIYRGDVLIARIRSSGLAPQAKHHAHALHSPYWWLKCALGVAREDARLPQIYHRFLVWELMRRPHWTRQLERVLNPILGKSLVVYAQRPVEETRRAAA